MNAYPEFVHLFSPYTRISLELPLGFEEQSEDEGQRVVIYADDLDDEDDDELPGARVVTHLFAVEPAQASEERTLDSEADEHGTAGASNRPATPGGAPKVPGAALVAAADASAAMSGRRILLREPCTVEALPALRQTLSYHETALGFDVLRHELWVQADTLVFSVVCVVPAQRAEQYRPAWEHATRTLRLVLPESDGLVRDEDSRVFAVEGRSWANFEHRFSINVPPGWEITRPENHLTRLFGPGHFELDGVPELDGYRPSFSIAAGAPEDFGDEWFDRFCEDALHTLRSSYAEFDLDRTERFPLSSLVEVNATWYRWRHSPELRFAQLQALVPVDRYRMLLINAATVDVLAERYLPLFDEILRSLRVL